MRSLAKLIKAIPNWVLSTIVLLLIAYLTLDSNPLDINRYKLFEGADMIIHLMMYFALCSAYIIDYAKSRMPHHTKVSTELVFCFLCIAIGLLFEILQSVITDSRTYARYDVISNTAGAIVAFLMFHFWAMHKLRRYLVPLSVPHHHPHSSSRHHSSRSKR